MGTIAKNDCDEVATKVATKLHTRFVVRAVRVDPKQQPGARACAATLAARQKMTVANLYCLLLAFPESFEAHR